jgi:hypothetical protein
VSVDPERREFAEVEVEVAAGEVVELDLGE